VIEGVSYLHQTLRQLGRAGNSEGGRLDYKWHFSVLIRPILFKNIPFFILNFEIQSKVLSFLIKIGRKENLNSLTYNEDIGNVKVRQPGFVIKQQARYYINRSQWWAY
jgi:hypothetical protein